MSIRLFALLLAGALMAPQPIAGKDNVEAPTSPQPTSWSGLSLPTIPHLDTIPWLSASGSAGQRLKVDILLGPKFESLVLDQHDYPPAMQTRDAGMKRN